MIVYRKAEESSSIVREEHARPQHECVPDRVVGTEFAGDRPEFPGTREHFLGLAYQSITNPSSLSIIRSWWIGS